MIEVAGEVGAPLTAGADDPAAPTRNRALRYLPYAVTFVVAVVGATAWLRPWEAAVPGAYAIGGDFFWMQAMFDVHGQTGVFGVSDHLGWPGGTSPWSYPQLGALAGFFAWVVVGWMGALATGAILWFVVLAAGLNSAAILFFFRGLIGARFGWLAAASALSLGVCPFVLARPYHANLVPFFVIPVVLGVLVRWPTASARGRLWLAGFALVASLLAPMWWTVVIVLMLLPMVIPGLVRREWAEVRAVLAVWAATLVGFLFQAAVALNAARAGEVTARGAWDSDGFGGHLSDLLVASPFLTSKSERLQSVVSGSSGDLTALGIVPLVGAWVCLIVVLCRAPRTLRSGMNTSVLAAAAVVSLLYFCVGGLGNLQAAAAVLAGGVSPARVWSRMLLVVALVGLGWLLVYVREVVDQRRPSPTWLRVGGVAAVVVIGASFIAELTVVPHFRPVPTQDLPEGAAVSFIGSAVDPSCPVAQMPQEGMPNPRTPLPLGSPDAYRGLVPYLLAPERYWSFGSWIPGRSGGLNAMPSQLGAKDFVTLRAQGFCALLFDKSLSAAAAGSALEGLTVAPSQQPDFDSPRYSVYLLSR